MAKTYPIVIIGRINVGKSTLFNCLTESKKAITSDVPGTTRDRNYGQIIWRGRNLDIIDTGGVDIESLKNSILALAEKKPFETRDSIEKNIIIQTQTALKQAALIIFLVDGQAGLMPQDKELALILKKIKKPVLLVCNKIDNPKYAGGVSEFYKLGLGKPWPVSALNGSGTGDVLDEAFKLIKLKPGRPKTILPELIKVAMIGKPNVGKSSLVNQLVGEDRMIVSEIPQTTREPQDTILEYKKKKIVLVDTAGLRKKARVEHGIEQIASAKTIETLNKADVVLFLIDCSLPINRQDVFLAGEIIKSRASAVIVANKWDLLDNKSTDTGSRMLKYLYSYLPPLKFSPVMFVSAKTGLNVQNVLDLVIELWKKRHVLIDQKKLNEVLIKITKIKRPVAGRALEKKPYTPYIKSLKQTNTDPPEFTAYLKKNQSLHETYQRLMSNKIQEAFSLPKIYLKIVSEE